MAKAPKLYTRLTRNVAGVASYKSLWLGGDHLMVVTNTGYSESYARVQLRDIKGFFVTSSDRRLGWGIGWLVFAVVFAITVGVALANGEQPIYSSIFLVLTSTGFVWNHVLGPGCKVFVVTGVQTAELPALVRRKKAHRVLGRVQPLIEAAQADLVSAPPVAVGEPPMVEAPPVVGAAVAPVGVPVPQADTSSVQAPPVVVATEALLPTTPTTTEPSPAVEPSSPPPASQA